MMMDEDGLTERIIACVFEVHDSLGPGFSEKVYENAQRLELGRRHVGANTERHKSYTRPTAQRPLTRSSTTLSPERCINRGHG